MIKYNSNTVSKWYDGILNAKKAYHGNNLIFLEYLQSSQPSYKLVAQYSDTSEYKVECNGNAVLTAAEVSAHTTPKSAMTSAIVGSCDGQGSFKIGDNAFYGASAMTSVTIDNAVTEIGQQSFMGCSGLTSFTFPSGLTKINGSTFRLCNQITNINVPNGVRYIGSGAFADMAGLTGATIPATLTGASTNLFLRDTNLKEVHFEGTTPPALGADAFKGCTALSKIYIPSCDSYDAYAANAQFSAYTDLIYAEDATKCKPESYPFVFKREHKGGSAYTRTCDSSSATTLTRSMTRSGTSMSVISGASQQVTAVTVGDCTKTIDSGAFSGWTKLTSIIISDSVTEIGSRAFNSASTAAASDCTLYLSKNLQVLRTWAFSSTSKIRYARIPSGITTMSYNVFYKSGLTGLTFEDGFNFKDGSWSGFCDSCSALTTVSLPSSVKYIPAYTFRYNGSLSSIDLSKVTEIGSYAFSYCSGLTQDINLSSITKFGSDAFANCAFEKVDIGSACTYIEGGAFAGNNNLMAVIIRAATPPTASTTIWAIHTVNGVTYPLVYVPDDKVNVYKNHTGWWQTCKNEIHPLSDLPS